MKAAAKLPGGKKFTRLLLQWNREQNDREMPWKGEKDPYKIWLSEIILQQTRVEQGLAYYNKFVKTFPDIHRLAKAKDEKVFKLWEGLGYYSRCRNLLTTARYISKERNGGFPETYEEIKSLKGIGPYTAAAISSFAFNRAHAVVDGNVFRVLARVFGVDKPIDSTEGKKYFTTLAASLLDTTQPGIYNQAIMDFGAVVCKPVSPLCQNCVFKKDCSAFKKNKIDALPVKEKKIVVRKRWFYYFILEHNDKIIIRQRTAKDIWQQLYEFPMIECDKEAGEKNILALAHKNKWLMQGKYTVESVPPLLKQQLSHQIIAGQFFIIRLSQKPVLQNGWISVNRDKLKQYALPGIIKRFLKGHHNS